MELLFLRNLAAYSVVPWIAAGLFLAPPECSAQARLNPVQTQLFNRLSGPAYPSSISGVIVPQSGPVPILDQSGMMRGRGGAAPAWSDNPAVDTSPVTKRRAKEEARSFAPRPGMAGVYLIRAKAFVGSLINRTAVFDGREFGGLPVGWYYHLQVRPGTHTAGNGKESFTAEAGQNYFFECGRGSDDQNPKRAYPLDARAGQSQVLSYKLRYLPWQSLDPKVAIRQK